MDHFWEQGQRTGRARAAYSPECVEGRFSELRPGWREVPTCRRVSTRHTSPPTADPPSASGSRAAGHQTSARSWGPPPPPFEADPRAAVACAPRATIPHDQAATSRAKTEVVTNSLRPVWSARPSTVRQAKHGAMKRR